MSSEERQEEACGLTEFSVLLLCVCACVCMFGGWWWCFVGGGRLEASTHSEVQKLHQGAGVEMRNNETVNRY